ncbi:hypothetical protein E3N88_08502 [Mikania micrantha]|uniref:Uncharacterized protein n=1 Tax=Mikania micrantha TaxID=192012 RepID=A0A5N6PIM8_9ASTR|nr:hypothetical protein E3N88_08502 [Mikania micrantha]
MPSPLTTTAGNRSTNPPRRRPSLTQIVVPSLSRLPRPPLNTTVAITLRPPRDSTAANSTGLTDSAEAAAEQRRQPRRSRPATDLLRNRSLRYLLVVAGGGNPKVRKKNG